MVLMRAIGNLFRVGMQRAQHAPPVPSLTEPTIAAPPPPAPTPGVAGVEIPYYPARGTPVPAATPVDLCESQTDLINRLHQASAFSRAEFDALIRPVIHQYAAYVHLLPASENHHHCGQGGLFRHGLEVAFNAAIACNGTIFAFDHWASERDKLAPRWRLAAILGGLIHDVGKPIIDVGALNEAGTVTWNPHIETLWDWIQRRELKHYYIYWREGARHKRHEAFNALAMDRIIPLPTLQWMGEEGGQEVMDALLMSLTGQADLQNPLVEIIKNADSKSVERDIRDTRQRMTASGLGGQRNLAMRLVRVMHDLVAEGTWKVNRVGDPLWVTDKGVFAFYPRALDIAIEELRKRDGERGLVRDARQMLRSLTDWGLIDVNVLPNGTSYETWRVDIEALHRDKPVLLKNEHTIRLSKEAVIPVDCLPEVPLTAHLLDTQGKRIGSGTVTPPPTRNGGDTQPDTQAEPPASDGADKETGETPDEGKTHAEAPAASLPPPPPPPPPLRDRSAEPDVRDEQMQEAVRTMDSTWPPVTEEQATQWCKQSDEGRLLRLIASRVSRGELIEGKDLFEYKGRVYLLYPKAFDGLGLEPEQVRNHFDERGWIERDRNTPNRITTQLSLPGRQPISAIRLEENISTVLSLLLPAHTADAMPLEPGKLKEGVKALGRYINKQATARMYAGVAGSAEIKDRDAVFVRPAFFTFLEDRMQETKPDQTLESLEGWELVELYAQFAKLHRRLGSMRGGTLLTTHPNPILLGTVEDLQKTTEAKKRQPIAVRFNPDYDKAADCALASTIEPLP